MIGTDRDATLTAALTVSGDVRATNGYFDYVQANELSIGEGFSIDASGNVALAPNVAANTGLLISKDFK